MMKSYLIFYCILLSSYSISAQQKWQNCDDQFGPLPEDFHVYKTTENLDGKPFIAYYAEAKIKNRNLVFTDDTAHDRRLTPEQFYSRNNHPLLVVNCSFFSYETNRSLNVVIKNGKMLAYNLHSIPMKGKDTLQYMHPFGGALGIDKKRNADVAWLFTDSAKKYPFASQNIIKSEQDSSSKISLDFIKNFWYSFSMPYNGQITKMNFKKQFKKWKMKTAIGGTPVLVQDNKIKITNEEEFRFTGKAINDKHPRTCIGYTADGRLIVMVIQGRFPGIAEGATLTQEAQLMVDLGCVEALNLDGGGSSCMLINGKETIKPSDKEGARPTPAVFIITKRK